MKHKEMVKWMGRIVTVRAELDRDHDPDKKIDFWCEKIVPYWSGWIVGFRYKLDGITERGTRGPYDYEPSYFVETGRQLAVMVSPWPTKKPIPVPITGFVEGGEPQPPDYGGWNGCAEGVVNTIKKDLSDKMKAWPRRPDGKFMSWKEAKEKNLV